MALVDGVAKVVFLLGGGVFPRVGQTYSFTVFVVMQLSDPIARLGNGEELSQAVVVECGGVALGVFGLLVKGPGSAF